jgi:hypothetical protein
MGSYYSHLCSGFIPVIGDFIGVFFALALVKTATKVGLPTPVIRQMLINVVIDFAVRRRLSLGDKCKAY